MNDFEVAAIIPAFNEERFIARALDSVLAQRVPPKQVLVIDDGSTDNTAGVVAKYRSHGFEHIYQANSGPAAARNAGIAFARCKYLAFLDGDDEWKAGFLSDVKALLKRHAEMVWVCAPYQRVSENGDTKFIRSVDSSLVIDGVIPDYFMAQAQTHFSCASSMVVRRSVFDDVGVFDTSISQGEDLDMWFRIALRHPTIGYTSDIGAVYWQKEGSITDLSQKDIGRALMRIHKTESHAMFIGGKKLAKCEPTVLDWVWTQLKEAAIQDDSVALKHISCYYGRRLSLGRRILLDLSRLLPLAWLWTLVRKIRTAK